MPSDPAAAVERSEERSRLVSVPSDPAAAVERTEEESRTVKVPSDPAKADERLDVIGLRPPHASASASACPRLCAARAAALVPRQVKALPRTVPRQVVALPWPLPSDPAKAVERTEVSSSVPIDALRPCRGSRADGCLTALTEAGARPDITDRIIGLRPVQRVLVRKARWRRPMSPTP